VRYALEDRSQPGSALMPEAGLLDQFGLFLGSNLLAPEQKHPSLRIKNVEGKPLAGRDS